MAYAEIMARVERRRKWTPEEKAALLAELEVEGGNVAEVARRHRISPSLLYSWRSAWKMSAAARAPEAPMFVPLGVLGPRAVEGSPPSSRAPGPTTTMRSGLEARPGLIEIELPSGVRVRVDGEVKATALRRIFAALKGAA